METASGGADDGECVAWHFGGDGKTDRRFSWDDGLPPFAYNQYKMVSVENDLPVGPWR